MGVIKHSRYQASETGKGWVRSFQSRLPQTPRRVQAKDAIPGKSEVVSRKSASGSCSEEPPRTRVESIVESTPHHVCSAQQPRSSRWIPMGLSLLSTCSRGYLTHCHPGSSVVGLSAVATCDMTACSQEACACCGFHMQRRSPAQ